MLHYRVLNPTAKRPWLTIAIDDVQDIEVAKKLIHQTWQKWGMRLVMTVPPNVANALKKEQIVEKFETKLFTVQELEELLKRHGKRWLDLPSDLKKLLRTPILAGLYVKLSIQSIHTAPESGYEIFHHYWEERLLHDRQQPGQFRDIGIVLELAGRVIDGKSYPCESSDWPSGLDNEAINRLKTSGWLYCNTEGDITFAHDRLLNWAIAKEVVRRFEKKKITLEELVGLFVKCYSPFWWLPYPFVKELRYVPTDTMWLLIAEKKNLQAVVGIVTRLEKTPEYGPHGLNLLYKLLPTLGQPIVPIFLTRLDSIIAEHERDDRELIREIREGLANLALQERVDLRETVETLLKSSSPDRQNVALAILRSKPMSNFLDCLWTLYQKRYEMFNGQSKKSDWISLDYDEISATLHVCVQQDSGWLRQKILHATDDEPVSEFAYVLYRLNNYSEAYAIWQKMKEILCHKMFLDYSRKLPLVSAQTLLLYCIHRFSDLSYHDFVIDSIFSGDDFTRETAFTTLAYLVPDKAVRLLFKLNESELIPSRKQWLPVLLRIRPEETRAQLLAYAKNTLHGNKFIASLFNGWSDELDEPLLYFLLRSFEKDMKNDLEQFHNDIPIKLYNSYLSVLDCLAKIIHPRLLKILAKEAGGNFENMLTEIACHDVHKIISGCFDYFLDHASRLLFKIGGNGFTTLINYELEYASHLSWARNHRLKWAIMVPPNEKTISLLAKSACRHLTGGEELDTYSYQLAIHALAALGADQVLVDTLFRTGNPSTHPELAKMRFGNEPMDKTVTEQARQMLETSETKSEKELLLALTIAWISADSEFIPIVETLLSHAEPSSSTARFAALALQQLGDRSDKFVKLLARLLKTKNNKAWATDFLLNLGKSSIEVLHKYLDEVKIDQWEYEEKNRILYFLYRQDSTQEFAENKAAQYCIEVRHSRFGFPYDIASDKPEIKEMVFDTLFEKSSSPSTLRAIEKLANFDSHRAVQVIEEHLLQQPDKERELCRLLIQIDPESAASLLVHIAFSAQREEKKKKNLYSSIGQTLRRLDAKEVDEILERFLQDVQRDTRTITVKLASWLPPGRLSESLGKLADHETEEEVRLAALEALTRQRQEHTVMELMKEFPMANRQRRWILLHCILETGDPFLLAHHEEPLWLDHILSNVPYVYIYDAYAELEKRKKEVES